MNRNRTIVSLLLALVALPLAAAAETSETAPRQEPAAAVTAESERCRTANRLALASFPAQLFPAQPAFLAAAADAEPGGPGTEGFCSASQTCDFGATVSCSCPSQTVQASCSSSSACLGWVSCTCDGVTTYKECPEPGDCEAEVRTSCCSDADCGTCDGFACKCRWGRCMCP